MKLEKAILGAGCFWHIEEFFSNLNGVLATSVGYSCGKTKNPTYKEVCSGETGHVEVVQINFDPNIIKYDQIIREFWRIHDPTSLDKQGPDAGTQYKSAICFTNNTQKEIAKKSKKNIQKKFKKEIVTIICKFEKFYKAEEYHQKYLKKNPGYIKVCKISAIID